MKTTRYFEEQVLRERPDIDQAWCASVVAAPFAAKCNRMVGCASGERLRDPAKTLRASSAWSRWPTEKTVHNAVFDRGFRKDEP